jgi:hypothetical protein
MGYFDRTTKVIKLVTDPEQWVKIFDELTYDELDFFNTKREPAEGLHKLIDSWSLELEPTLENVRKLKAEDIETVFREMTAVLEDFAAKLEKKKGMKTSNSSKAPEKPSKV